MSRFELPEGVPADNEGLKARARFSAPDMATPSFAKPSADFSRVVVVVDEDEDEDGEAKVIAKKEDEDDDAVAFSLPPRPWLVVGGIAVALIALSYIVANKNVEPQPYCSQQPEWNQYNCIPG
ncbi:hypothetical protein [Hyphococcus sp.]|jgi:hypothetical protein|uniref:hypothetical protein n=1 Tax=Hyphococcus sp. TaxID=2038636 RepID=UPI003D0F0D36